MYSEHVITKADIRYKRTKLIRIVTSAYLLIIALALIIGVKSGTSYHKHEDTTFGDNGGRSVLRIGWFNKDELIFVRREWGYHKHPMGNALEIEWGSVIVILFSHLLLLGLPFIAKAMAKYECSISDIVVTDTRVYGSYRHFLSKQSLDMPIEKVDSLKRGMSLRDKFIRSGETLKICTASSIVSFHFVQNADEVVTKTMKLITEIREKEKPRVSGIEKGELSLKSSFDKLQELNQMKKAGLISEEEYDKMKTDILSKM